MHHVQVEALRKVDGGGSAVETRRPAAISGKVRTVHSQNNIGLVRVQDEALHGCGAQVATRPFSSPHIRQYAANVAPATPSVFSVRVALPQVRNCEVPTLPLPTLIMITIVVWRCIPPLLLLDRMAIETIARLDLAKDDVTHVHV